MPQYVKGSAVLSEALKELADMRRPDWKKTLRSAVRDPMVKVQQQARSNIAAISPGKAETHRTYKKRLVTQGFASRSIAMEVIVNPEKGYAVAILGVRPEAFYVLSFFELGTSAIPRHPWLTPALEQSKDRVVQEAGEAMRKRIDAIAKKRMRESERASR
jgi:HK97 gp10 family phage protein